MLDSRPVWSPGSPSMLPVSEMLNSASKSVLAWDECICRDFAGPRLLWDGYLYNCRSQFIHEVPRLRVGKVGETSLAEAWRRMNRDPVLDAVRRLGVSWLAEKARDLGVPIRQVQFGVRAMPGLAARWRERPSPRPAT